MTVEVACGWFLLPSSTSHALSLIAHDSVDCVVEQHWHTQQQQQQTHRYRQRHVAALLFPSPSSSCAPRFSFLLSLFERSPPHPLALRFCPDHSPLLPHTACSLPCLYYKKGFPVEATQKQHTRDLRYRGSPLKEVHLLDEQRCDLVCLHMNGRCSHSDAAAADDDDKERCRSCRLLC